MKKKLVILVIGLCILAVLGYFGANYMLQRVTNRAIVLVSGQGQQYGIEIKGANIRKAQLTSWNAATWSCPPS